MPQNTISAAVGCCYHVTVVLVSHAWSVGGIVVRAFLRRGKGIGNRRVGQQMRNRRRVRRRVYMPKQIGAARLLQLDLRRFGAPPRANFPHLGYLGYLIFFVFVSIACWALGAQLQW